MIRTFFAYLAVILFTIVTIPVLFILWLIGFVNMKVHDVLSYALMKGAFTIMLWISGVDVTVIGRDRIPRDKAVLFVGNHRSYYDIIISYKQVIAPTGFVAKKEFKKVPVLSHWISCLHGLFLDRQNIKEGLKTILEATENMKNGMSYFIFPEGTRSKTEGFLPFKEGSMKIAVKSGGVIVPFAITHSDEIFEKQFPYVKSAKVTMEFGNPIYTSELTKDQLKTIGADVQKIVEEMYKKNY